MLKCTLNRFCLLILTAVLFINEIGEVSAQSLPDKQFRIMNATADEYSGMDLHDGEVNAGISAFEGQTLADLKVYVMFTVGADSLIAYQRDNAKTAKLNAYIRHYEEKQYLLHPNQEGVFSLADANWIAEDLYKDFKPLIDYWIQTSTEPLNPYSIALVVYHESKGAYEKHNIEPIIHNNSTDTRACVYYSGMRELRQQYASAKMKTGRIRKSTIVKGSNLPITENILIQGKSSERLVIDRKVEPCLFQEDLWQVQHDFAGNDEAKSLAQRYLGHQEDLDSTFRQLPFVFAGENFQKSLYRRTAGVLERDTFETYRRQTNKILASQLGTSNYKQVAPDTLSFALDHSLWNTACQYQDFEPIQKELLRYARLQQVNLPADGGQPLDVNEEKFYTLEVDSALFGQLSRYVERGHQIAHRNFRTSADMFIPGWISTYTDVVPNASDSVYYQVQNSSILALQDSVFAEMIRTGRAIVLSANQQDSVYRIRLNSTRYMDEFEDIFKRNYLQGTSSKSVYLSSKPQKATYSWEFRMPNVHKFYRMVHVNYMHDFIHVDTTSTIECPCDRTTPLMFLAVGAGAASFDCPPFVPGSNQTDDFRPISSSRDIQTVHRSSRLLFSKSSATIDRKLGKNDSLLNYISTTIDHILWLDDEEGITRRRIDSVQILGISSPEGNYNHNAKLSDKRAHSLGRWISAEVNKQGGQNPRIVSKGSIATWTAVADTLEQLDSVGNHDLILKIRAAAAQHTSYEQIQRAIGHNLVTSPQMEQALALLRKTEVRFFYQDIQDPSEEMVVKYYRSGGDLSLVDAYYYWTLLTSKQITQEEKVAISQFLLHFKHQRVQNFTTTHHYRSWDDFYDLVLPMAATILVKDSINLKVYNTDLLSTFIDTEERSQRGNAARFMTYKGESKVWKYINLDFVLYNQILNYLGKGDQKSLREADRLIQLLLQSPTTSEKFDEKYHRKVLSDYLKCFTSDFLTDERLAQSISESSVINYYVVNMAIAHQLLQMDGGSFTNERMLNCIQDCYSRLEDLKEEAEKHAYNRCACYYFTAVTEARYAQGILKDMDTKNEHYDKAIKALVRLFKADEQATFIGRCQGDSYIRGIYRTQKQLNNGRDLYLEAVETYINDYLTNENKK